MDKKVYKRIIGDTQAKFKVIPNEVTQQSSYNLPMDFEKYAKENNIIIMSENAQSVRPGITYILNENYKFILGETLINLIGEKYRTYDNIFMPIHTQDNSGKTPKCQLFRKVYNALSSNNEKNYKWFVDLYDRNCAGNELVLIVNEEAKELILDINITSTNKGSGEYELDNLDENDPQISDGHLGEKIDVQQIILFGPPGTGKSFEVTKKVLKIYSSYSNKDNINEYVFRTTLHEQYNYYDFIGNVMPVVKKLSNGSSEITYEFQPGIFTQALTKAILFKQHVFLILEEMSRTNVAAVFGDIFQLLDRDEQGESEYKIKNDLITISLLKEYEHLKKKIKDIDIPECLKNNQIFLPSNLHILGTVNTSDQNVFVMDNAFKRRFEFEYIDLDPKLDNEGNVLNNYSFTLDKGKYKLNWIDFYREFNIYIVEKLNYKEDKQIGQFFIKFKSKDLYDSEDMAKIKEEYNFRQLYTKLLQYIWNDIHLCSLSNEKLISNEVKSFSVAYKKLKNKENIFTENFIAQFINPEFNKDIRDK